jgi:SMODS and SLOG-associating 2TM effector domain 1
VNERAQQFVEVYRQARVEDQLKYYDRSAKRLESAHRQLLLTSAVVFGLSGAFGLIAGLDVPGKLVWAIVATLLPALTTALSAFEGLYAFERLAKLYGDAARNLKRVQAPQFADGEDERAAVAGYVADVERIFRNERGQWGQLKVDRPDAARPAS